MLYDPTWSANESFKAKSYNLQYPASQGAIDAIAAALTANPNGWVQLSSFGVCPTTCQPAAGVLERSSLAGIQALSHASLSQHAASQGSNKAAQSNSFQALQDPPHALISVLVVLRCGMRLGLVQGAVNSVPWKSTAYAQRGMLYNMQYYVAWNSSSLQSSSLAWINGLQVQLPPSPLQVSYRAVASHGNSSGMEAPCTPTTASGCVSVRFCRSMAHEASIDHVSSCAVIHAADKCSRKICLISYHTPA